MQNTDFKKTLLLLFLIHFLISGKTQGQLKHEKDESPSAISACSFITLKANFDLEKIQLPFSTIEVEDLRQDTSKMGYLSHLPLMSMKKVITAKSSKICTEKSLASSAFTFLNAQYQKDLDSNSPDRLLICIKKCWFSDYDNSHSFQHERVLNKSDEYMYFKAEMYLRSGESFFPMYRFDSVFTDKKNSSYKPEIVLANVLTLMVERLRHTDFSAIKQKRPLNNQEVKIFNSQSTNAPIFQVSIAAKGVYMNFEEFKNNRPSFANYDLESGELTDNLRVQEKDGLYYIKGNAWCICDGINIFINLADKFFKLYATGKTWEFYGGIFLTKTSSGGYVNGQSMPSFEYTGALLYPYQVDIETGKFY